MTLDRTKRLLTLFYLFDSWQEVNWQEIEDWIRVNPRTIKQDLAFLRQAGLIRTKYNQTIKGYQSLPTKDVLAQFPEGKAQRRYMERIIRIARLIDSMECSWDDNLIDFFREHYPNISDRTRQRNFNLLREMGFTIYYTPAEYEFPGHWSYKCLGYAGPYHQENI